MLRSLGVPVFMLNKVLLPNSIPFLFFEEDLGSTWEIGLEINGEMSACDIMPKFGIIFKM